MKETVIPVPRKSAALFAKERQMPEKGASWSQKTFFQKRNSGERTWHLRTSKVQCCILQSREQLQGTGIPAPKMFSTAVCEVGIKKSKNGIPVPEKFASTLCKMQQ